jgi:hypothetical protein
MHAMASTKLVTMPRVQNHFGAWTSVVGRLVSSVDVIVASYSSADSAPVSTA